MKFEDALKAMREGKKVTFYGHIYYIQNGEVRMDWSTGERDYPVTLNGNDILSEDWEIVDE